MIDIHSHILFGLDDGAQNVEEMLEMARQAVADGISVIVATPHHNDGQYDNPPECIYERCTQAQVILAEHEIPIEILPGMEMRVSGDEVAAIETKQRVTYNDQQRHLLLELPHDHVPRYVDRLVFDLQVAGYVPIIAHPERNREIASNLNLLYRLVQRGAMAQLTAGSVSGVFGKRVQKTSLRMIQHDMIHFIATDAHNTGRRGAVLSQAHEVVRKKFGQAYVTMYQDFARRIIQGLDCSVPAVQEVKKNSFRWLPFFNE